MADLARGHVAVEIALIVSLQFLAVWVEARSYAAMVGLYTALLALFFTATGGDAPSVLELRFAETLVGAGGGFLVAWLAARDDARRAARVVVADLLDACAKALGGRGVERSPAAVLTALETTIAPGRMRFVSMLRGGGRRLVARRMRSIGRTVHLVELAVLDGRDRRRAAAERTAVAEARRDGLGRLRIARIEVPHERARAHVERAHRAGPGGCRRRGTPTPSPAAARWRA